MPPRPKKKMRADQESEGSTKPNIGRGNATLTQATQEHLGTTPLPQPQQDATSSILSNQDRLPIPSHSVNPPPNSTTAPPHPPSRTTTTSNAPSRGQRLPQSFIFNAANGFTGYAPRTGQSVRPVCRGEGAPAGTTSSKKKRAVRMPKMAGESKAIEIQRRQKHIDRVDFGQFRNPVSERELSKIRPHYYRMGRAKDFVHCGGKDIVGERMRRMELTKVERERLARLRRSERSTRTIKEPQKYTIGEEQLSWTYANTLREKALTDQLDKRRAEVGISLEERLRARGLDLQGNKLPEDYLDSEEYHEEDSGERGQGWSPNQGLGTEWSKIVKKSKAKAPLGSRASAINYRLLDGLSSSEGDSEESSEETSEESAEESAEETSEEDSTPNPAPIRGSSPRTVGNARQPIPEGRTIEWNWGERQGRSDSLSERYNMAIPALLTDPAERRDWVAGYEYGYGAEYDKRGPSNGYT